MIMPPLFVWGSFAQTCTCFFLFREALHKCAWLHFLFGEALHKRARISFYSGKPCTNVHVFLFIQGSLAQMCMAPLFVWGSHVQSSRLHFLFGEAMYKVRSSTFYLGSKISTYKPPLFVFLFNQMFFFILLSRMIV